MNDTLEYLHSGGETHKQRSKHVGRTRDRFESIQSTPTNKTKRDNTQFKSLSSVHVPHLERQLNFLLVSLLKLRCTPYTLFTIFTKLFTYTRITSYFGLPLYTTSVFAA